MRILRVPGHSDAAKTGIQNFRPVHPREPGRQPQARQRGCSHYAQHKAEAGSAESTLLRPQAVRPQAAIPLT